MNHTNELTCSNINTDTLWNNKYKAKLEVSKDFIYQMVKIQYLANLLSNYQLID